MKLTNQNLCRCSCERIWLWSDSICCSDSYGNLWRWHHQQHNLLCQPDVPRLVTWRGCLQCEDPEGRP